ncbi:hypothetical protein [Nocardioides aestuarii]|uniref:Uncharacterized protein n=1 Tax=Nocardioides aestuarii TaxID=252231 RepID=A0ABW4TRN7_9ACTN
MALDDWCDRDVAYLLIFGDHPDVDGPPSPVEPANSAESQRISCPGQLALSSIPAPDNRRRRSVPRTTGH